MPFNISFFFLSTFNFYFAEISLDDDKYLHLFDICNRIHRINIFKIFITYEYSVVCIGSFICVGLNTVQ